MSRYNLSRLPRRVQGRLDELVAAVREIAEEELASIVVHGSAATGTYSEARSDINLLVVLHHAPRPLLDRMGNALAVARAAARIEARILVTHEIARAADVFPLVFSEIREHHVVLHGSDPFEGLEIEDAHLRLRIEQELREVAIDTRAEVARARGDRGALTPIVHRALRRARPALRALLGLLGQPTSHELDRVLDKASRRFKVDPADFARSDDRPETAYDALDKLLDRAVVAADELLVRGA